MTFDQRPEAILVRASRARLRISTVAPFASGPYDVAVSADPADIRRTSRHPRLSCRGTSLVVAHASRPDMRQSCGRCPWASRSFPRYRGCTHVLRVHQFRLARSAAHLHQPVIPVIAPLWMCTGTTSPTRHDDDVLMGRVGDGFIGDLLQGDDLSLAIAAVEP